MTSQPVPWLPAAGRGDFESALGRVLDNWLASWVTGLAPVRVQLRSRGEMRTLPWRGAAGSMVGAHADAEALLGRDICGGAGDVALTADRDMLRKVATALLDDLATFLAGLAGPAAAPSTRSSIPDGDLFTVSTGSGGWTIALALAPATMIVLRKMAAGFSRRPSLGRRAAALAPLQVRLGCHLGQARLSAGEIASLAVDDVIVFDRQPGAALPLTVEGRICASGRASIVAAADGAVITVAERASLLRKIGHASE